jgi:hypothetical protein
VVYAGTVARPSDTRFRVLHALRVKGFSTADLVVDLTGLEPAVVDHELAGLTAAGLAVFREARSLWQLTAAGREAHTDGLTVDTDEATRAVLGEHYTAFVGLNEAFKELCGDWQLRAGVTNPHDDPEYDRAVIDRLLVMDTKTQPVCAAFSGALARLDPYGPRLAAAARRVDAGEHQLFTGVMCGSYHDIWMELHEDLIITLAIDRTKEGSF